MRIVLRSLPILFLAVTLSTWGQARPSIAIEIRPTQNPAKITVILKNVTDHRIDLMMDAKPELSYTPEVADENGKQPPTTQLGEAYVNHGGIGVYITSGITPSLDAGKSRENIYDLTKLFALKPGRYTVQLSRIDQETKQLVKSNTISITVTK